MSFPGSLLSVAHEAVDIASKLVCSMSPGVINRKGDRDFASDVDVKVERTLRDFLGERTPGVGFVGEEEGATDGGKEFFWTLDPLDGTSNFIHKIPLCGISLGLVMASRPVLGVIDLPFLGERYSAVENDGAFAGARRISVRETMSIHNAVISIGDYAVGARSQEKNRLRLALTHGLAARAERVRMFGSAAIDLAWVACGRTDASIALSNNPWDMAAGVIIAREAGARVFDKDGSDYTLDSTATIVTSRSLAPDILMVVREATA